MIAVGAILGASGAQAAEAVRPVQLTTQESGELVVQAADSGMVSTITAGEMSLSPVAISTIIAVAVVVYYATLPPAAPAAPPGAV